jgi:hypothetical protein
MTRSRMSAALLAVALATGLAFSAGAAEQSASLPNPQFQTRSFATAPPTNSQLSNYDPYTHNAGPCPQGGPDGLSKCRSLMPPSYPLHPGQ